MDNIGNSLKEVAKKLKPDDAYTIALVVSVLVFLAYVIKRYLIFSAAKFESKRKWDHNDKKYQDKNALKRKKLEKRQQSKQV